MGLVVSLLSWQHSANTEKVVRASWLLGRQAGGERCPDFPLLSQSCRRRASASGTARKTLLHFVVVIA